MIKNVIFDCFGTLIDTGGNTINAIKEILAAVDSDISPELFYTDWKKSAKQAMKTEPFRNEKQLFVIRLQMLFDKYGIGTDAAEHVKPLIGTLFGNRKMYPEVPAVLSCLKENNINFAIGSTTDDDSLDHYLRQNGLHFDMIFTSEGLEVYKPDILFYKKILDFTLWNASETLFVGDSYEDDVAGPKKAGFLSTAREKSTLPDLFRSLIIICVLSRN